MKSVTSLSERRQRIAREQNPTLRFLSESLRRPLSIRIDTDNIAMLNGESVDAATDIAAEVALWRQILGNRDVANIELRYRENALPTYDITRLMHGIASEFKLVSCEYRVVLCHNDAERSALALLKGLGFTHCQFEVSDISSLDIDALAQAVISARAFRFNKIGIQIVHSDVVETLTQNIRMLKERLAPDYLFIGKTTYKLPTINNDSGVTLFEDDIFDDNMDHLALGPDSKSDIQGRIFDSFADAKRYVSAIATKQLPLIEAGFPNSHSSC